MPADKAALCPRSNYRGHDKKPLSEAINRKLNAHDIEVIESALSIFKNLRDLHFEGIASRQDIKRTLGHISNCEPDKALLALSKCDEFTRAQIEQSLWCDMQERSGIIAEMIPSAAGIALERLNNSKPTGGAPSKGYQILFAEYSVNLWRHCGGVSMALWRKDESGELSPMLAWSCCPVLNSGRAHFDWKKTGHF
jgi:hypothetical protein